MSRAQPQAVVMNSGVDDLHPHRIPTRNGEFDRSLWAWRFSWMSMRALRQAPEERRRAPSQPLGWDAGPLKAALEHVTRMKAAAQAGQSPLSVGAGPFGVRQAAHVADCMLKGRGTAPGRRKPAAPPKQHEPGTCPGCGVPSPSSEGRRGRPRVFCLDCKPPS